MKNSRSVQGSGQFIRQTHLLTYGCSALFIIVAINFISAFVAERPDRQPTLITNSGAVLCRTPFQLRKAIIAADSGDGIRVRQLDCTRPGPGVSAELMPPNMPLNGPWQVKLKYSDGVTRNVWGYADDFQPNRDEP